MATVRVSHQPDARAIRAILASQGGAVTTDLLRRGMRVQTRARRLVRVDKGRLRGSILVTFKDAAGIPVVSVGSNVEYAIYQEMGTRYMTAKPYLRPGLAAARD